jgi:hypothetical protein
MTSIPDRRSEIRRIVANAIGLTPADMADDVDLMATFATDWRTINAALSTIEDTYHVTLAVDDVGERPTISSIYRATARQADWTTG